MDLHKNLSKIFSRSKGKNIFFLLDYDGTLTPIVKHPGLARLTKKRKAILRKLANKFLVAIISGREVSDVSKKAGLKKLFYAGNHGFELRGRALNMTFAGAERFKKEIKEVAGAVKSGIKGLKGVFLEDKGFTLSLHYRMAKHDAYLNAMSVLQKTVKPYVLRKRIKLTYGKKVVEIRPNIKWDKGEAVKWLMEKVEKKFRVKNIFPVYIGDDSTDEDAFRVVKKKGVAIVVGKRRTKAQFFVKNVPEVYRFFEKMLYNEYKSILY